MKKTLSLILALVMTVLMIPVSVLAADIGSVPSGYTHSPTALPVSTVAEFEEMSSGNEYYLTKNIDFGGKKYTDFIATKADFILDGCGYAITNFSLDGGSSTEIAMYKQPHGGLTIKNLTIGSETSPIKVTSTKGNSGLLLLQIGTNVTFENLKLCTSIDSTGNAGAITPYLATTREVIVRNCEVFGSVNGSDIGGFFGHIKDASAKSLVIDGCINNAAITADERYKDAGGIVGYSKVPLTITNCINRGAVTTLGERAGGIIGGFGFNSDDAISIIGCLNYGNVTGNNTGNNTGSNGNTTDINVNAGIGGIIGCTNTFVYLYSSKINIDRCMNYGNIRTNGLSAGAIMGKGVAASDAYSCQITIKNCGNTGSVTYGDTTTPVGSFVSAVSTEKVSTIVISNCFNAGTSNSPKALAGVYNLNGDPSNGDASVADFYYLSSFASVANASDVKISSAVACTGDQFGSGEVAFALGVAFGQKLGIDPYPIPGGPAVTQLNGEYVNINTLSTDTDGSAKPYVQETEAVEGKQSVRFVIAVDSANLDSVANVEMTIVFEKAGVQNISYTLKTGDVKLFKSVVADSVMYMGDNGVVLLGAAVDGVVASEWDSTSIVLTVKDENGAAISELCVSATYTK